MSTSPVRITSALLKRWPLPTPNKTDGKEERGSVLVIGGSRAVAGAVLLSAIAALRAGAGKLHVATVGEIAPHLMMALPEAKVTGLLPDKNGEISKLSKILMADSQHANAILLGPGMRPSETCLGSITTLIRRGSRPIVLDAGGIRACRTYSCPLLITPHAGEMASLMAMERDQIEAEPLDVAREVAFSRNAFVALKGATTYVVSPGGEVWIHEGGSPGLGTSGSGDVLAGILTGLLARGANAEQALVWAVWLHAQAGKELSKQLGPMGFLAREIALEVPRLLAR